MKVFAENRKARNSYEFLDFYEAGVVLSGPETKSVRSGGVSIVDAFANIDKEEAYIMEMNIEPYKYSDNTDYNPKSQRKLLLHKGEIKKLIGDKNYLDKILLDGVEKANLIAYKKIERIKEIVGF